MLLRSSYYALKMEFVRAHRQTLRLKLWKSFSASRMTYLTACEGSFRAVEASEVGGHRDLGHRSAGSHDLGAEARRPNTVVEETRGGWSKVIHVKDAQRARCGGDWCNSSSNSARNGTVLGVRHAVLCAGRTPLSPDPSGSSAPSGCAKNSAWAAGRVVPVRRKCCSQAFGTGRAANHFAPQRSSAAVGARNHATSTCRLENA